MLRKSGFISAVRLRVQADKLSNKHNTDKVEHITTTRMEEVKQAMTSLKIAGSSKTLRSKQ